MRENKVNENMKSRAAVTGASHGSALANRIADALMTNGEGKKARRLQLRDSHEKDLGGYCRQAVLWLVDKELDAAALRRSKPALFRKIRGILKKPNYQGLSFNEQCRVALSAKVGDIWKSNATGRTVTVIGNSNGTLRLKHETGRVTQKKHHYFAYDYTPNNGKISELNGRKE